MEMMEIKKMKIMIKKMKIMSKKMKIMSKEIKMTAVAKDVMDFVEDKDVAGKRSFEAAKLAENVKAIVSALNAAKPATVKGVFIKSMSISSTMGVGVPVVVTADAE